MVTSTARSMPTAPPRSFLKHSESTITNDGRISPAIVNSPVIINQVGNLVETSVAARPQEERVEVMAAAMAPNTSHHSVSDQGQEVEFNSPSEPAAHLNSNADRDPIESILREPTSDGVTQSESSPPAVVNVVDHVPDDNADVQLQHHHQGTPPSLIMRTGTAPPARIPSSGTVMSALTIDSTRGGQSVSSHAKSHAECLELSDRKEEPQTLQDQLQDGKEDRDIDTAPSLPVPPPRPFAVKANLERIDPGVPSGTQPLQTPQRAVSECSRDSLRYQIQKRTLCLTRPEQSYLEELAEQGNEIEVQLALQTLQDPDLFFDHSTPKHHLGQPMFDHDDDEREECEEHHKQQPPNADQHRHSLARTSSQGSQRRMMALEQRRTSQQHATTLWKAHQQYGLAMTKNVSRASLTARRNSISSSSGSQVALPKIPSHHEDIFRQNKNCNSRPLSPSKQPKKLGRPRPPAAAGLVPAGRKFQRSRSLLLPGSYGTGPKTVNRRSSFASNSGNINNSSSTSYVRSKSVTFHSETDGTPKPKPRVKVLRRSVSDTNALQTPAPTSSSSTVPLQSAILEREESVASIPSLHPAEPIRQESTSSFPSLHHGHPIRQESISSIPSLHHGHPIRDESVSSIPSLHHGHPIRQESMSSIPSLHHGNMLHDDSASVYPGEMAQLESVPSLYQGQSMRGTASSSSVRRLPARSDSIPSLHHGHPLVDSESVSSRGGENVQPNRNSYSDDIAKAWMNQPQALGHGQLPEYSSPSLPEASIGSIPNDVTFPSEDTEDTFPETVNTEPTVTSSATSEYDITKPVVMRLATKGPYEGEGIEVTELQDRPVMDDVSVSQHYYTSTSNFPFPSLISMDASIRTCNSWDTGMSSSYHASHAEIFRNANIVRSLSDDEYGIGNLLLGASGNIFRSSQQVLDLHDEDSAASWDMNSEIDLFRFDSWNILKDDYINGYGGGGSLGFRILGTDADDEAAQPHVLSPPLMESLQAFMPLSKSGENFYLKYSMVRDGASLHTFLKRARGVQYTILALENIDGEVLGAFTGQAWRKNWNYFGTGESFLWRMRRSRLEKTHDILDQAQLESEVDVYPYTGENRFIQLCTHDRIAVGGGSPTTEKKEDDDQVSAAADDGRGVSIQPHEWGFGLALAGDLLTGTSSPCVTFGSPSLSHIHSDGSLFEIVNMELWTLTPCGTAEEAEKLELGKLFLARHTQ